MLNNGDKLIVTKTVAPFLKEGDIVEVTNVADDGIISFAFGDNFMHMGVMNTAECEAHFEKVEEKMKAPAITEEYVAEILDNSEFEICTMFDKCTVVSCKLPNGFIIVESSACVSPENYDEEIGAEICVNKIADKVWELEAYRLQQQLWEEKFDCGFCCDDECKCDCERCEGECDDCDVDCDNCEEYECPFNTNN